VPGPSFEQNLPNPFWKFSLAVYARPRVADACLSLQDSHSLDVNLLLFCLWYAIYGSSALAEDELRRAVTATRSWQDRVVGPLRTLRRRLKTDPCGMPSAAAGGFRLRLQEAELAAERIEQDRLFALAHLGRSPNPDPLPAACAYVVCYLRVLDVAVNERARQRLATIIAAALGATARKVRRALNAAFAQRPRG
jgi:uncharacterized protein (TIGR02444 family)